MNYQLVKLPVKNILDDFKVLVLNKEKLANNFNGIDAYLEQTFNEIQAREAISNYLNAENPQADVIAFTATFKSCLPKLPELSNKERTLKKISIFALLYDLNN